MTVIKEHYLHGKHNDESVDEDGIFIGERHIAVIDGVTSKSVLSLWQPTPGVVAKNTVMHALATAEERFVGRASIDREGPAAERRPMAGEDSVAEGRFMVGENSIVGKNSMSKKASAAEHASASGKAAYESWPMRRLQRHIDGMLRAQYTTNPKADADFFRIHPIERLQANAVGYSAEFREIWLFGDCQAMVNGRRIETVKEVDLLLSAMRSFVWQAREEGDMANRRFAKSAESDETAATKSDDPGRDAIMPFLRMQSAFTNKRGKYGYFVFDGFTDAEYPIRSIRVTPGDEVVLASDGYPILERTLARSEAQLARLKADDPHLIDIYPSTKGFTPGLDSFDDRAYIRFIA